MNEKEQELLARIVDLFASEFANKALLRGGMVLRVMGSARHTNDLDYLFVPYKSKKAITAKILACLRKIENSSVKHSLNSQCLRILLIVGDVSVQIEAKVALEVKSSVISTKLYSPQYNLPKRLIHVVDHSVSMANKLAAWNERRLVRDLYDIWFFLQMSIVPDQKTLKKRLSKPRYTKLVNKADYFKGEEIPEFYDFVRRKLSELTDKQIEGQLSDYFAPDELEGLVPLIRHGFVRLR
jgi:predicted nucleotidyltransferase component of viral defense system